MADIINAAAFSVEHEGVILKVKSTPGFDHKMWSCDELENVRAAIRDHYKNEQGGRCAYCRNPVSLRNAFNCHVEHIAPKSIYLEFIFEPKNLCVICSDCNTIKRKQEIIGDVPDTVSRIPRLYPRSSGAFLIVHPHFDNWDDHIIVFGKYYADKTQKGHFTIGACELNRHLRKFGWEPPLVNDAEVRDAMNCYLNNTDCLAKAAALTRLMRMLGQL